jgi:protein-tyrosine phosphatase
VSDSAVDRSIAFEACFNFRDLGGYAAQDGRTVRYGRLFRADALHRLTEADGGAFRALRLRTVIDLRSNAEISDFGRLRDELAAELAWHQMPVMEEVLLRPREIEEISAAAPVIDEPGESYARMIGDGAVVARVFNLLGAEGSLPAVFHCTAGKDRTGIMAAMTLDLLGVSDDVIAADYVLTDVSRPRSIEWINQHEPAFAALLAQFPPERRVCRPEMILGFLERVRAEHGSVEDLLLSAGVDAAVLDRLRDDLLEG